MRLNPPQMEAVHHLRGPLLILAGAGSGKTRVIVHRIAHLLSQGFSPETILAVSFTNKAVREMEERVEGMLQNKLVSRKLTLKTFHSLGVAILRLEIHRLGYTERFTIYDDADQLAIVRRVMKERKISEESFSPQALRGAISTAKNLGQEPDAIEDEVVSLVFREYDAAMKACGALDFDDLIRLPVRILRDYPDVLQAWSGRFEQIMIDEYQDTNPVQLAMSKLLSSVHNNICVVGDDDQSIYGWRGSDVEIIRKFDRHFPGAKQIMLTQNYRCSGSILGAANAVIAQSPGRYTKELWTDQGPGILVGLARLKDEEKEAHFVMEEIQRLQFEQKRPWSDFAILYRTNGQSEVFEDLFLRERIPHRVIGGQRFFERKEIKDIVAYLRCFQQTEDEIALRRILNIPSRGIGTTSVERVSEYARVHQMSFFEACRRATWIDGLARVTPPLLDLTRLIERYQIIVREQRLSRVVEQLLEELRFSSYLYKEYTDLREAKQRIDNLDFLLSSILRYEDSSPAPSLEDYLERVSLEANPAETEDASKKDGITLMTLHSAKGLEFPVVFLVGLEDGLLPYLRQDEEPDLEEERRLCYVGITRAKQRLTLSHVERRRRFGKTLFQKPSRFLEHIPPSFLTHLDTSTKVASDTKVQSMFAQIHELLGKK